MRRGFRWLAAAAAAPVAASCASCFALLLALTLALSVALSCGVALASVDGPAVPDETPREVLESVARAYARAEGFSMRVTVSVHETPQSAPHVFRGAVARDGARHASSLMGMTTIVNERMRIVVDDGRRLIVVSSPAPQEAVAELGVAGGAGVDPAPFAIPESAQLSFAPSRKPAERTVVLVEPSDPAVARCELTVDSSRGVLTRATYHYRSRGEGSPALVDIRYDDVTFGPVPDRDVFDEGRAVRVVSGRLAPTEALKGYRLVDQRVPRSSGARAEAAR